MAPLKWQIRVGRHQRGSSAPRQPFHPSLGHFLLCFTHSCSSSPCLSLRGHLNSLLTDGGYQYEHISLHLPTPLILTSILSSLSSSQLKGWSVPLLPKALGCMPSTPTPSSTVCTISAKKSSLNYLSLPQV